MIKLKNVSKFYYSKGVIASGFSKVNVEFNIGEFVAITGESGSGKSTLLNVISGLDTYEEGEMYVDGKETSHYMEKDWEDYRRKYIGNIYQNFNLINSYTVYQNIELVLILNGLTKKEARPKVLELIKKVNLEKFTKTKVSKLSGGQKQRVAIARALAKDVPVIIADEPTGNLDKRSAESIIRLLKELSKDKLVIIVTHNYEQISEYATRKITMHDGKILEDKKIKDVKEGPSIENNYQNITFFNKIRLGIRNTFNVLPKFILLLIVYLFIVVSLMAEYSSFKKSEYENSKTGYNYIFQDLSEERIIINKKDKSPFTDEELDKISKLDNISNVMRNDVVTDRYFTLNSEDQSYVISGTPKGIKQLKGKLAYGRLPENDNEIVVEGPKDDYYLSQVKDALMKKTYSIENEYSSGENNIAENLKIVGIKYAKATDDYIYYFYFSDQLLNELQFQANQTYSTTVVNFLGKNHQSSFWDTSYKIVPNDWVSRGKTYISEDNKYSCPKENCINQPLTINVSNLYYQESLNLSVEKYYNIKNIANVLNIPNYKKEDYENYNGIIFINKDDYNSLYNKATYQVSVYVKDARIIDETLNTLNKDYNTLAIKDVLVQQEAVVVVRILKIIVTIILVVALFFITYFVIKLILKSRNIYYTTIRMLGSSKKVARQLLVIELFVISNLAYFSFMGCLYLNKINIISYNLFNTINDYLIFKDYLLLYIILIILSFLTSEKYAAKIFKNSVMNSYREEV